MSRNGKKQWTWRQGFKGLASKAFQLTRNVFANVEEDQVITTVEMCQARDVLICLTTIKTGTRPGALTSGTLKHYHTMQRDEDTGQLVLLVTDHKRSRWPSLDRNRW